MRKLLVLTIMALSGLSALAQDVIKLKKGEKLQVKVLKVTPSYIEYSYPNEDAVIQIKRKKVASIHYESGRTEEFTPIIKLQKTKANYVKEEKAPRVKSNSDMDEKAQERNYNLIQKIKEQKTFNSPLAKKQMFYAKAGLALNMVHFYDCYPRTSLEDSKRFQSGEALDIGYSRYIKDSKFYWAAEIGLTTRGHSNKGTVYFADEALEGILMDAYLHYIHHGIKMAPAIFGYRFLLSHDYAIDLRIGGYFTYYYFGKRNYSVPCIDESITWTFNSEPNYRHGAYGSFKKDRRYNAGFETGIAFWYKRFCFDFTYNVGFVSFERMPIRPEEMSKNDYWNALDNNPESLDWKVKKKNYNYNIQFKLGIAF